MFSLTSIFSADDAPRDSVYRHPSAVNFGHYMTLADDTLNLISIFDDLKYDRADADMMSPAMRRHGIQNLAKLGFRQTSGTI